MSTESIIAIVSALVAAVSARIAWKALRPKPSLRIVIAYAHHIPIQMHPKADKHYDTAVLLLCWITNKSTHAVHLVNFQAEVDIGHGYEKWDSALTVAAELPPLNFTQGRYKYKATLPEESFLFWPPAPVEYGTPLIGFLPIYGTLDGTNSAKRYRLTVKDSLGHVHTGEVDGHVARDLRKVQEGYVGIRYLVEMAGAHLSRVAVSQEEDEGGIRVPEDIKSDAA